MSHALDEGDIKHIGHYEVLERVAEGGFGAVFRAHDPRLDREVAIKILHPYHASDPVRVARFQREARSAAKLHHQGIVQVFDVVEMEGRMALVMEFVRGQSLNQYLKDHPNLTLDAKLEIGAQIAETLDVAHKAGIVHRDVKPANVMLDEESNVKLTDFGLARLVDSTSAQLTGENNVLGTPAYMSPEQCQGLEAGPQSDLYSLGIILYEMTAGAPPFEAENFLAVMRHHTDTPPTPVRLVRPSLPPGLERLIMKCLAKSVESRPASGAELAQSLRGLKAEAAAAPSVDMEDKTIELPARIEPSEPLGLSGGAPAFAPQPTPSQSLSGVFASKSRRVRMILMGLVVVGLIALGAGLALFFRGGSSQESRPSRPMSTLWSETPLLDYVNTRDDAYEYVLHSKIPAEGYSTHVLDMTSQRWRAGEVVPEVWKHWLTVIVPERVNKNKALIVCSEGLSTADRPMSKVPEMLMAVALSTQSVVAILEGFPRGAVHFADAEAGPEGLREREQFAVETFMRFLDTEDTTWPICCPMVKTVVRAMDTLQDFADKELGLDTPLDSFILTGEANGWGIWLTGAVDTRVAAIAPIQFDLLNIQTQIEHQVGFRGSLSPFLSLFSETDILPALDSQEGERLLSIIDPYSYRTSLTMPKLLLLPASSSPYTTIDSTEFYLDDLEGDTYLFCAPNVPLSRGNPFVAQPGALIPSEDEDAEDGYITQDFRDTLQVFYHKLLVDKPMPKLSWDIGLDGAFRVVSADRPAEVRLWLAKSETRDFSYTREEEVWQEEMLDTLGEPSAKTWKMERLSPDWEGVYEGRVKQGPDKYTAFYIEFVFPSMLGINFSLTTPTTILTAEEKPTEVVTEADESTLSGSETSTISDDDLPRPRLRLRSEESDAILDDL